MKPWELRRAAAAVFLPNRCPFCDELIGMRELWCGRCYNRLRFMSDPEEIPEGLDGFMAVCCYSGRARSAVIRMKQGYYRYPIDAFAALIAENAKPLLERADVITAVPTGRARKLELGYAQSEKIAKLISEMTGIPYLRALSVTADKCEQKLLNAEERRENALRAFSVCCPEAIRGKSVLVIDDVCTTGATLWAVAEKLRNSGAASVMGAVFAKTVRK